MESSTPRREKEKKNKGPPGPHVFVMPSNENFTMKKARSSR